MCVLYRVFVSRLILLPQHRTVPFNVALLITMVTSKFSRPSVLLNGSATVLPDFAVPLLLRSSPGKSFKLLKTWSSLSPFLYWFTRCIATLSVSFSSLSSSAACRMLGFFRIAFLQHSCQVTKSTALSSVFGRFYCDFVCNILDHFSPLTSASVASSL